MKKRKKERQMKNGEKGDIDPITLKRGSNNRRQKW